MINKDLSASGRFEAITPSDTVDFTDSRATRRIYVGGAGNIVLVPADGGAAVTFTGVPVGAMLEVAARRVNSTNTTATNLVALF